LNTRGYYGIGIYHPKHEENQGTLWRSAFCFGAAFIFTIGRRFTKQITDTTKAYHNVPMYTYKDMDDFLLHRPYDCPLVGVEISEKAIPLDRFAHPARCLYLLGAEDHGLPPTILEKCQVILQITGLKHCLNVSTAGSILMYDRLIQKVGTKTARREGRCWNEGQNSEIKTVKV
jgi:tRNA G18 (ribose-2'-O)-methylase SpoU